MFFQAMNEFRDFRFRFRANLKKKTEEEVNLKKKSLDYFQISMF